MAYKLDGKDIVISGFENGIADSPYQGISDMRNVDIISVPQEASVAFAPSLTTTQGAISNVTFTADPATEFLTYDGVVPIQNNTAILVTNSGGALPAPLAINTAYYVVNKTATTFQLALTATGAAINITTTGTGTQSFSTINMGQPKYIVPARYYPGTASSSQFYVYFAEDNNGRIWYYYQNSQWIYLRNLSIGGGIDESAAGVTEFGNGLVAWKGFLHWFRRSVIGGINYYDITTGALKTITQLTTIGNWAASYVTISSPWNIAAGVPNDINHYPFAGITNDVLYYCNSNAIGSISETPGSVYDPTSSSTFTSVPGALILPANETAQCINQLGTNVLIGGVRNVAYSWDRISPGYVPVLIAENNIARIVVVNTSAYLFAGNRGRIYISNGSQAQLYKKMPDHLSGTVNPYYTWGDAMFTRNQLYFGVQATTNTGVAINQYGGMWGIDLDTSAIRLVNQQSYGSYSGITSALCPILGGGTSDGFGVLMGWYTSTNTTGGIDISSSTPYTGGQSYVDSDYMPLGTYLDPFTPSQLEWKTAVPIGANGTSETVALYYRLLLSDSFTLINSTTSTIGQVSDTYTANFQKAQWVQIRAALTSNATTPTYNRLTEIRIRDFPSGKDAQ